MTRYDYNVDILNVNEAYECFSMFLVIIVFSGKPLVSFVIVGNPNLFFKIKYV